MFRKLPVSCQYKNCFTALSLTVCAPLPFLNSWAWAPKWLPRRAMTAGALARDQMQVLRKLLRDVSLPQAFSWRAFSRCFTTSPPPLSSSLPFVWEHCSHKRRIKGLINSTSFVFYPIISASLICMGRNWDANHSDIWDDGECSPNFLAGYCCGDLSGDRNWMSSCVLSAIVS